MLELEYITRGNSIPYGKAKVFLSCHQGDVLKATEGIVQDILKVTDCAIYYTKDMTDIISEEEYENDIKSMNLVVVPVTRKLLLSKNRTLTSDVPYALQEHIPILPIITEPGLEGLYSKIDIFCKLQFLDAFAKDSTQIAYTEKLKKYLDSVLSSNEEANRIRNEFDAYIFLSYRKKDRQQANELMKIIHSNPMCRDISIWYDEFLIPGENFNENISVALKKSDLFTMLITPNIINEDNYVQRVEYPAAINEEKNILPVQMLPTDIDILKELFEGIPDCVDVHDEAAFKARIIEAFSKYSLRANDDNPEHNYLIGLAYLGGIDVEVDRTLGAKLITLAADDNNLEAMQRLRNMYHTGVGVDINLNEAVKWSEKIVNYHQNVFGDEDLKTITEKNNLAILYIEAGEYQKAI